MYSPEIIKAAEELINLHLIPIWNAEENSTSVARELSIKAAIVSCKFTVEQADRYTIDGSVGREIGKIKAYLEELL
jgi:hypothetical protein